MKYPVLNNNFTVISNVEFNRQDDLPLGGFETEVKDWVAHPTYNKLFHHKSSFGKSFNKTVKTDLYLMDYINIIPIGHKLIGERENNTRFGDKRKPQLTLLSVCLLGSKELLDQPIKEISFVLLKLSGDQAWWYKRSLDEWKHTCWEYDKTVNYKNFFLTLYKSPKIFERYLPGAKKPIRYYPIVSKNKLLTPEQMELRRASYIWQEKIDTLKTELVEWTKQSHLVLNDFGINLQWLLQ